MNPLDLVKLTPLMQRTRGRPELTIALIDGPVVLDPPGLAGQNIRLVAGKVSALCSTTNSVACRHRDVRCGNLIW